MWNTFVVGTRAIEKLGILSMNRMFESGLCSKNLNTQSNMPQWTGRVNGKQPTTIEYIDLPDERIDEALAVVNSSWRHEPIAKAFGLYNKASSIAQLELLHREIIEDRCSVIAVEKQTDKIVGVGLNKILMKPKDGDEDSLLEFVRNNMPDEECRDMIEFYKYVESKVDVFEHYNVECLMELAFGVIDPRFWNHGIGNYMTMASVEIGRRLSRAKRAEGVDGNGIIAPEVALLVSTSDHSQRLAMNANFEWLATFSYDEYLYRGKKLSEVIGDDNKTIKVGGLRLV